MTQFRAGRGHGLLPERFRKVTPPKWWQEIGAIAIVYYLYSLVRNRVPSHEVAAFNRARSILTFEGHLHLNVERSLNLFVAHHSWLAYISDYYYATLHFVVTIGVLVWLYVKHPMRYRPIRTVLLITNLVALIGFWFVSVAPPRMMHGFVDTVVKFHTWGSLASPGLAKESNQFAAMPSLHIGWSLWCALAIVSLARRRWVRVLGALYPVTTLLVILGTGNHFVLDAAGGVVTLLIAIVLQRVLFGRPAFRSNEIVLPDVTSERELISA